MLIVWAAFFTRQRPVSMSAKPACMNMTRKPAISVQTKLIERKSRETALAIESTAASRAPPAGYPWTDPDGPVVGMNWLSPERSGAPASDAARQVLPGHDQEIRNTRMASA